VSRITSAKAQIKPKGAIFMNKSGHEIEKMLDLFAETLYQVVGDDTEQLDAKLDRLKLELKRRALLFAEKHS
jgi:peptidyl-tRNA hydrolase